MLNFVKKQRLLTIVLKLYKVRPKFIVCKYLWAMKFCKKIPLKLVFLIIYCIYARYCIFLNTKYKTKPELFITCIKNPKNKLFSWIFKGYNFFGRHLFWLSKDYLNLDISYFGRWKMKGFSHYAWNTAI